jgi:phenylalanyl-tRNA synthetase beta chain
MNILVSYNWLKDYVEIKDSPKELARKLSLCGPSIERIIKEKDDYIFDTEVTTNRPDVLSMIGFAREISAIAGGKLKKPYCLEGSISQYRLLQKNNKINSNDILQVQIQDKKNCPRYMAIVLDNIKVKKSPEWMQKRLLSYGVRPINNIVDVTNFVMVEYGQPMHAFDYDKISGKKIIVRKVKKGEKIISLDNDEYNLDKNMLVIADAKEPIAIAGVKGGKKAEIDLKTKKIILEAANFNEVSIRKTARALNLYSESSTRFEKGLSDQLPLPAMARAVELVQNLIKAKIASPLIDQKTKKYQLKKIELNKKNVEKFLAVKISSKKIVKILESLGFEIKKFVVTVPFWRDKDVEKEVDLIEEIARIYGYHKLPIKLPTGEIPQKGKNWNFFWENKIKEILSGAGMAEVYSYSFISEKLFKKCEIDSEKCLKLLNPLNADLEYMRPSLIPSLLQIIFQNQKIKEEFEIFELANVYLPKKSGAFPNEKLNLCGAIIQKESKKLFYQTKGIIELLFKKIGIDTRIVSYMDRRRHSDTASPPADNLWHLIKTAEIFIKNESVGIIGEINQEILKKFDIDLKVAMFDFDFQKLIKYATTDKAYQPIIKFPPIKLDLAIVLDKKILWNDIQKLIYKTEKNFVKNIEVFDIYEGRGVPKGKKSLAFHITYQSTDRTLEDREINKIQEKIINALEKNFKAEIRK